MILTIHCYSDIFKKKVIITFFKVIFRSFIWTYKPFSTSASSNQSATSQTILAVYVGYRPFSHRG